MNSIESDKRSLEKNKRISHHNSKFLSLLELDCICSHSVYEDYYQLLIFIEKKMLFLACYTAELLPNEIWAAGKATSKKKKKTLPPSNWRKSPRYSYRIEQRHFLYCDAEDALWVIEDHTLPPIFYLFIKKLSYSFAFACQLAKRWIIPLTIFLLRLNNLQGWKRAWSWLCTPQQIRQKFFQNSVSMKNGITQSNSEKSSSSTPQP